MQIVPDTRTPIEATTVAGKERKGRATLSCFFVYCFVLFVTNNTTNELVGHPDSMDDG